MRAYLDLFQLARNKSWNRSNYANIIRDTGGRFLTRHHAYCIWYLDLFQICYLLLSTVYSNICYRQTTVFMYLLNYMYFVLCYLSAISISTSLRSAQ